MAVGKIFRIIGRVALQVATGAAVGGGAAHVVEPEVVGPELTGAAAGVAAFVLSQTLFQESFREIVTAVVGILNATADRIRGPVYTLPVVPDPPVPKAIRAPRKPKN